MTKQTPEDISVIRSWAGKRRGTGIMAALAGGYIGAIMQEMDHVVYVVDDLVIGLVGAIVLILYLIWRKHGDVNSLKRDTNVFSALLLFALLIKIIWLFGVEIHDPDAIGDDIPSIYFLIVVLLNRFM